MPEISLPDYDDPKEVLALIEVLRITKPLDRNMAVLNFAEAKLAS